jgi:hypothetical protein
MRVIISAILLIFVFSDETVKAAEIELHYNAPDRYVVVQGDTLWGIASRFLKDPWRWPEIWHQNRDSMKNPHMIYPGDIIVLEKTAKGIQLKLSEEKAIIKLSPKMRIEKLGVHGIPTIPIHKIKPFLSQPLVIERHALDKAPLILGSSDNRVILSTGEIIYVQDLPHDKGSLWQVFRASKALMDPDDNNRILGYEAIYLGDVEVKNFAKISSVTVTHSVQEILKGDRLLPSPPDKDIYYMPHAPHFAIKGRIISVYGGITEIGENAIITLNRGTHDGLKEGHVLAVYRKSEVKSPSDEMIALPDERIGLVLIFRVFDKVSYALITQSSQAIKVLDAVKTP